MVCDNTEPVAISFYPFNTPIAGGDKDQVSKKSMYTSNDIFFYPGSSGYGNIDHMLILTL